MFAYEYKCTEYLARASRISSYENPNYSSVTNDYTDSADLFLRGMLLKRSIRKEIKKERNKHTVWK